MDFAAWQTYVEGLGMGFQPSFQRDWDPPKLFSGAKKYSLGGRINPHF